MYLEAVEIEEDHRQQVTLSPGVRQSEFQPIVEEIAIGQPGQQIVGRVILELRVRLLFRDSALLDVLQHRVEVADEQPDLVAAFALHAQRDVSARANPLDRRDQPRERPPSRISKAQ